MRAKFESIARQTGVTPPELENLQEFPVEMQQQWEFFVDLHNKRTSNGFGLNPISWEAMSSYFNLIQYQPWEWELKLISKLDAVALSAYAKEQERNQKKQEKSKPARRR